MNTQKKIVLITGGSRGIGKATALACAQKGIDVILTYCINKGEAEKTVDEIKKLNGNALALELDLKRIDTFDDFANTLSLRLQEEWNVGQFNYLINNAGIGGMSSFLETTEAQFDELVNVHLKGVFFLTQKLAPLITDHGGIINISTGLTRFTTPGASAYASVKGAIEVLTKYMAKELGTRGIRANVIAPGPVDTDLGGPKDDNQGFKDFIGSQTVLGRIGKPDDIAGVIASLCSSEMEWITAQRIEVSGGMIL